MVAYTTNKTLAQPQVAGDSGVWGGELNNNLIAPLDLMLGGVASISLSATDYTLDAAEIENLGIKFSGLLLASVSVYSACIGVYYVENNCTGNYPVTLQANFGAGGVGTGWNIPQGSRTLFVSDTAVGARPLSGDVYESFRRAGIPEPFAGATAPFGYVLCYGQAISRALYPYLYTAIGTTYGTGDGSTTFNVPDLRGRSIFGLDTMGGLTAGRLTGANLGNIPYPSTLGSAGGEENHTQTIAETPAHPHGITDPGHLHPIAWTQSGAGGGNLNASYLAGIASNTGGAKTGSTSNATTNITINPAGGGTSHNTTPPGMVMNWIIKV